MISMTQRHSQEFIVSTEPGDGSVYWKAKPAIGFDVHMSMLKFYHEIKHFLIFKVGLFYISLVSD